MFRRTLLAVAVICLSNLSSLHAEETATPQILNERMGVACHLGKWKQDAIFPMIRDLGVGWVRDESFWGRFERTPGKYEFPEETRAWLKKCKDHGLKVVFILNGSNPIYDNIYDPDAYARWAAWMAVELKGYAEAVEILNEPNNFGFAKHYGGQWNGNGNSPWIAQYVNLINKAAVAIKAANPDMKVIGLGAPAPANFRMLSMGILPQVDGIVDHPYSYKVIPEIIPFASSDGILKRDGIATADEQGTFASQLAMYREQSAKFSGPREIWLTEWGYADYTPLKPAIYAGFSQSAQAKYAQRRFVECMGEKVNVSFWYDFRNDANDRHDAEHNFGLVTTDLKPKPVYYAIQSVAKTMLPWKAASWGQVNVYPSADRPDRWPIVWDGSKLAAPGTIMQYQFSDSAGRHAVALWSAERADGDLSPRVADVELKLDRPVASIECVSLFTGQSQKMQFQKKEGNIRINQIVIPDSPVLLILSQSN